jgi:biotin synthase
MNDKCEMIDLIKKLEQDKILTKEEFTALISADFTNEQTDYLYSRANFVREQVYGKDVYMRGLVEFTNCCKNDCYYCGIRRGNKNAERYRLNKGEILECCKNGYNLGFRTFVLQGGDDPHFNDNLMAEIIRDVRENFPDAAITLSIGEKPRETYKLFREAGADRYLLRHETANDTHYRKLHPPDMKLSERKQCLYDLKELGYQTGCGFMVGSPFQTYENIAEDLLFIARLKPHMTGIGPFIPHSGTVFANDRTFSAERKLALTLKLLSIIRLMLPEVLLPATTALGTIHPKGREMGIKAGANVVMPNLSPVGVRKNYLLYDNKICTGEEAAECVNCMRRRMKSIGYNVTVSRGDYPSKSAQVN